MKKFIILLFLQFFAFSSFAQTNKEIARTKVEKAIRLMDDGQIDESIRLLQECQELDPESFIYPYEIAYAHFLKEEYEEAIQILKPLKTYQSINSQVYQMLGNGYSYLGNPDQAIKEYEEGMKYFPNAGNLHLEKGNIYFHQDNFIEALKNYEKGVEVDPNFSSNYFWLTKLLMNSNDKLSGLIYGEIFMNLERTTERTKEISALLYNTYQSAIILNEKETKIKFCDVIIDTSDLEEGEELKLPLCMIFGKNFILGLINEKEFNLNTLSNLRQKFIENYFKEDYKKYPNVLFEYHKTMMDLNLFDAYNHYLFQMGDEGEFEVWLDVNWDEYERFVDWYTLKVNDIPLTRTNKFTR